MMKRCPAALNGQPAAPTRTVVTQRCFAAQLKTMEWKALSERAFPLLADQAADLPKTSERGRRSP